MSNLHASSAPNRAPRYRTTALLIAALIGAATVPCRAANPVAERERLVARLDSLEVVKQHHKRRGLTLADLERQTARIKDSLAALKEQIESGTVEAPRGSLPSARFVLPDLPLDTLRPASAFDWVIVSVGAVALLSGLILLIGLLRGLFTKGARRKKKQQVSVIPRQTAPPPNPARPKAEGPPPPPPRTDTTNDDIAFLRDRIAASEPKKASTPPPHLNPQTPTSLQESSAEDDIKNKVLAAAREGLSISQISRRFHIGADHVALILKVAGREGGKGS